MFDQVFVERSVLSLPRTQGILERLRRNDYQLIDKVDDIFGRAHKPYLQKRTNLNLFIGAKKGQLVKPAPPAYGTGTGQHYYFIHQYNCIFECQYCYLQGYFNSPDIVLFVNHDEICAEIRRYALEVHSSEEEVWFHAGEFSDSLALSGITRELEEYWNTFSELPNAFLELRTKSSNIKLLEEMPPLKNVVVSFSLSPTQNVQTFDRGTPPLEARLRSMRKLSKIGFRLGIHLDPIIYHPDWRMRYQSLAKEIADSISDSSIAYISIGTVRFTKPVFRAVERHYPESAILAQPFTIGDDGKRRYSPEVDAVILNEVRDYLVHAGFDPAKIYECMEQDT